MEAVCSIPATFLDTIYCTRRGCGSSQSCYPVDLNPVIRSNSFSQFNHFIEKFNKIPYRTSGALKVIAINRIVVLIGSQLKILVLGPGDGPSREWS